jgi:hypothetical protein
MTVSLTTRGILCTSSPSIASSTWGIICIPLAFFTPFFVVGPSSDSPSVTLLGKKQVNLVENIISLIGTPISPTITSPDLKLLDVKEVILINNPELELSSSGNGEDEEIYNKEDPELFKGPK